jgi:diguanylate cyclase (GGDEF)-like protein/PAS domain S-box-containing protein
MDINFSLNYKHLLDHLNIGVIIHGKESEIIYANNSALNIMNMTWLEMIGQTVTSHDWHLVDKYNKPLALEKYPVSMIMSSGQALNNYELGVMHKGELVSWILCNARLELDEKGGVSQIVITLVDITQKHEHVPFKKIVDLANDVIIVTEAKKTKDVGYEIVYVNNAFTKLTGYSSEESIGKTPKMLQGKRTSVSTRNKIDASLNNMQPIRECIYNYSKTGAGFWLDINIVPLYSSYGDILYFAAVERDITEQKEKEDTLSMQASRDSLTGLLNRRGFTHLADSAVNAAITNKYSLVIAMIDVDHFKKVNDSYGHDIGDKTLCKLAEIMQSCFRKSDLLGRFGGEEFIIVISGSEENRVQSMMNEFREKVANTVIAITPDSRINLTISIGLAFLDKINNNFTDIVKAADTALYQAKSSGRNKVCI